MPIPACGLTASPGRIKYGESAHLNWSSTNATTVVISPHVGKVTANGSIAVTPPISTTYEIVASGADGTLARGAVHIEVTTPGKLPYTPVSGTFTATPDMVLQGESVVLAWQTYNATHVIISPDVGAVSVFGKTVVAPLRDTTYVWTFTNDAGGYGRAEQTVRVSSTPITR